MNKNLDITQSFIFQDHPIKGLYISLDKSYQDIINCHSAKANEAILLGEALLAACCLLQPMKIEGQLTIQFQSENNVGLLVAKATTKGELRGIIDCKTTVTEPLLGAGYLVVTVLPDNSTQPSQSLVELPQGQNIANALTRFFAQSEQLPSSFVFAVNDTKAVGMMLQRMPSAEHIQGGAPNDAWNEISHLFCTLQAKELLTLPINELLHRLFHEHDLRLFEAKPMQFNCPCSREKMSQAVLTLSREEALDIFNEQKLLEVTCEYCKAHYTYSQQDVLNLFASKNASHH